MSVQPQSAQPKGASLRKEVAVETSADSAWDAIGDFASVHTRVAPGFLTDLRMDGGDRILTFHNGAVARELLVSRDEQRRRLVYAIPAAPFESYSAAIEVAPEGEACRVIWTIDVIPAAMAAYVDEQMAIALPIMKTTLEA